MADGQVHFHCIMLGGCFFSGYRYTGGGVMKAEYANMSDSAGQVAFFDDARIEETLAELNAKEPGHVAACITLTP